MLHVRQLLFWWRKPRFLVQPASRTCHLDDLTNHLQCQPLTTYHIGLINLSIFFVYDWPRLLSPRRAISFAKIHIGFLIASPTNVAHFFSDGIGRFSLLLTSSHLCSDCTENYTVQTAWILMKFRMPLEEQQNHEEVVHSQSFASFVT